MLLLSLLLTPKLSVGNMPLQAITVTNIDPQADQVCIVFTSLDEMIDLPNANGELERVIWAPVKCWYFSPGDAAYGLHTKDWDFITIGHTYDVSAYVSFPGSEQRVTSNVVRVIHGKASSRVVEVI